MAETCRGRVEQRRRPRDQRLEGRAAGGRLVEGDSLCFQVCPQHPQVDGAGLRAHSWTASVSSRNTPGGSPRPRNRSASRSWAARTSRPSGSASSCHKNSARATRQVPLSTAVSSGAGKTSLPSPARTAATVSLSPSRRSRTPTRAVPRTTSRNPPALSWERAMTVTRCRSSSAVDGRETIPKRRRPDHTGADGPCRSFAPISVRHRRMTSTKSALPGAGRSVA